MFKLLLLISFKSLKQSIDECEANNATGTSRYVSYRPPVVSATQRPPPPPPVAILPPAFTPGFGKSRRDLWFYHSSDQGRLSHSQRQQLLKYQQAKFDEKQRHLMQQQQQPSSTADEAIHHSAPISSMSNQVHPVSLLFEAPTSKASLVSSSMINASGLVNSDSTTISSSSSSSSSTSSSSASCHSHLCKELAGAGLVHSQSQPLSSQPQTQAPPPPPPTGIRQRIEWFERTAANFTRASLNQLSSTSVLAASMRRRRQCQKNVRLLPQPAQV